VSPCVRKSIATSDSEPRQCQRLSGLTRDEHDANNVIDLVRSATWRCARKPSGRDGEHVSKLNREYTVNIYKEPSL
jgi:hypothetical protein